MYTSAFTTPEQIIAQLAKADSGTMPTEANADYTAAFVEWKRLSLQVSDWFQAKTFNTFVPYYEAKAYYFDELFQRGAFSGYRLTLTEPLLEIDSVTWISDSLTSSQYRLQSGSQNSRTPYTGILFDYTSLAVGISSQFSDAVTIAGWWGYHTSYPQAWTNMETVSINGSATSLTVADSSIYETYSYLRLEDELLWITALTNGTTLTVQRGVNGTTAAAHSSVTARRWNVQPAIALALTRFVAWAYDNRANFGTLQFTDGSAVVQSAPTYVQEAIDLFTRLMPVLGV